MHRENRFAHHLMRKTLYLVSRYVSGTAVTCLTGVRHFNVPDLHSYEGVLLVSNHQSFLDPVLVGMPLERRINYLARSTLFDTPVFGSLIRALGTIPLRRGTGDGAALRAAMSVLKDGRPLLLFPEGTRSSDGSLGTMSPGAAMMAARCKVPVIPTYIEGAFDAWPKSRTLPRPARTVVVYGEPLPSADNDGTELNQKIMSSIVDMREFACSLLDKSPRK